MPERDRRPSSLATWQALTVLALLVGYSGYYVCRSDLAVALPLLVSDPASGLDRTMAGVIASAGILAYAIGKAVTGVIGDFLGGRRLFVVALWVSVATTVGFSAARGGTLLIALWMLNRFAQSAGWGGLTKIAAHWFPAHRYGTVMSVLSLSFLFGDALGRYGLGALLSWGVGWRGVFVAASATLSVIGVLVGWVLRDSPRDVGLPEPAVHTANLFGAAGAASRPASLSALLRPYATSVSFWLVCLLACGLTVIRESFNTWIPVFLVEAFQLTPGLAARYSALFPLLGGVSTLLVGVLADRVAPAHRVQLIVPAMGLCAVSLALLAVATMRHDLALALWATAGTAVWLLGPYSLLAGAVAMDFGGRSGTASAAGLIDCAGYVGGALSGVAVSRLAQTGGWATVFLTLAGVAVVSLVVAWLHGLSRRRPLGWQTSPQFT